MMDKTININLGGTLFHIDEAAYRHLRDYLQSIDHKFRNVPGGNETIEDIEFRIAEIFQSKKGTAGVISEENVEEMIRIIGKPEDFGQSDSETASDNNSYGYSSKSRGMYRNPDNSIIGGVCGGMGAYLNADPVWFRILFVAFTLMFGLGFLVYLALWIALPSATSEKQKKDMYGGNHNLAHPQDRENLTESRAGHVINEIFKAFGKVFYLIGRILLIIFGMSLVLSGFLALFVFISVFIFKYPGVISTDVSGINIAYVSDFLYYALTPKIVPWIKGLIVLVVTLPLLALIYGGVRMIFWFRTRDGYIWLAGLVLWIMSVAGLSILLFNEGIGFSETEKTVSREYFMANPDTLYIISGRKITDLDAGKKISIPDANYNLFLSEEKKEIYIRTNLDFVNDENNSVSVEVRKCSAGRSRTEALENAKRLEYNFHISGNTLILDEFSTIPAGTKWSLDNVGVTVRVPDKTVIHMDKTVESLFHSMDDDDFVTDPENRYWIMTENGLNYIGHPYNSVK
jgi:phage shock protein PspC (stress-responsive transcriptional regulator)